MRDSYMLTHKVYAIESSPEQPVMFWAPTKSVNKLGGHRTHGGFGTDAFNGCEKVPMLQILHSPSSKLLEP